MLLQKSKKLLMKSRRNVESSLWAQDTCAFDLFHSILRSSVVCAHMSTCVYKCAYVCECGSQRTSQDTIPQVLVTQESLTDMKPTG